MKTRSGWAPWLPRLLLVAMIGAGPAGAVPIAPNQVQIFRDKWTGELLTPGANLASDPSLSGTIIAAANRRYEIEVSVTLARPPFPVVQTYTVTGSLHDWVVRRADTGTLDFYFTLEPDNPGGFAGLLWRPWFLSSPTAVEATFRDDIAGDQPPTWLGVSLAGHDAMVSAAYYATDDSVPNWIASGDPGAPVLFRSDQTAYTVRRGSIEYIYMQVDSGHGGSTGIDWFSPSPVPEPGTWLLLSTGLLLLRRLRARASPA